MFDVRKGFLEDKAVEKRKTKRTCTTLTQTVVGCIVFHTLLFLSPRTDLKNERNHKRVFERIWYDESLPLDQL
jgi:hypothetical protein